MLPAARRALRTLAATEGVEVVFVSGRPALDLARRARVGGARYIGNHGLESGELPRGARAERLRVHVEHADPEQAATLAALADAVAARIDEPWLYVERKGAAVAFHYRAAADPVAAQGRIEDALREGAGADRFQRLRGRRVIELRPLGAVGKAETLSALIERWRPASVIVLGDDVSDARAFRVLAEQRSAGGIEGLAVAIASSEAPVELFDSADTVLPSPEAAARFLAGLARLVSSRRSR